MHNLFKVGTSQKSTNQQILFSIESHNQFRVPITRVLYERKPKPNCSKSRQIVDAETS